MKIYDQYYRLRRGRWKTPISKMSQNMKVKLLIDSNDKRVVYVEADKDFVDFLCHMIMLPVSTALGLSKDSTVGSLTNLYGSIATLNDCYIQTNVSKSDILNPPLCSHLPRPLLAIDSAKIRKTFYGCCGSCASDYVSDEAGCICPQRGGKLGASKSYVAKQASGEGGFVNRVTTYTVTDDLVVKPISTMGILSILQRFNVKGLGDLEEKVVDVGPNEGVKLLTASWQTKNVLTEAFLNGTTADKKPKPLEICIS